MNHKILSTSLLILILSHLPAQASCQNGNPRLTEYIRRNLPNRCEGIKRESVSGISMSLVAIAIRNIPNYNNTLTIQIPRINGGNNLDVKVQSLAKSYQLDNPSLSNNSNGSRFTFTWDTYVLKKEQIPPNSLYARAIFNVGSQKIYAPVILGQTSGNYEFVFFTENRAKFRTFEIMNKDKQKIYSTSRTISQSGEIIFAWDGRNAQKGLYQVHVIADLDSRNKPTEKFEQRYFFQHDPNWLK
jgi:flagellar hook assembly protein FlgD